MKTVRNQLIQHYFVLIVHLCRIKTIIINSFPFRTSLMSYQILLPFTREIVPQKKL